MTRLKDLQRTARWAAGARLSVLAILLASAPCFGQIVGATLSGTVTDASGAAVPGAVVTATNAETGLSSKTTADEVGNYLFPRLNPAIYNLTLEKTGFKATVISGIKLLVDQKARVDATLEVGAVATTVKVSGAAPLVETATASVGTVINEQQVVDLPLNLRRYGALALLVPGTVPDNNGMQGTNFFSETPYSANGARTGSNNFLIDGVEARQLAGNAWTVQPPPDAVREFKIQTNIYSAAFGMSAGSTSNLVLKTGTNELHGSVYEFLRNDKLDARNFFAANSVNPLTGAEIPGSARPEFRRNQFGFGIGGPIRKNKTFFFGNYEGLRYVKGLSLGSFVPTDLEKAGDFSGFLTRKTINLCGGGGPANLNFDSGQLFDPATEHLFTCPAGSANADSTILVGNPIPGNIIHTIDPAAQKVEAFFPEPNRPGFPNFLNQHPKS